MAETRGRKGKYETHVKPHFDKIRKWLNEEFYNWSFSNEEKNSIIEEARKNASRIVNDALLRAEKIELKASLKALKVKIDEEIYNEKQK